MSARGRRKVLSGLLTVLASRGLGNSTFPFRVNNRPEVVVLTIE